MKKVLLSLLVIGSMMSCAEKTPVAPENPMQARVERTLPGIEGEIFTTVQAHPEFPGGVSKMYEYIGQNIKYPAEAKEKKVEGKVFVRFIIDKDGKVSNPTILKALGSGCEEEVTRVITGMPAWSPGTQDGKPVNVWYTMPVAFKL